MKGISDSVSSDIDIVLLWVDGNDKEWQNKKAYYGNVSSSNRYKDWDTLKYVFRGIECFLPWIRKVHFVTEGHLPPWLNMSCKKISHVKHSEYFYDQSDLPTFNSNPILLNLSNIDELSEKFILFNDDTFVLQYCPVERFFNMDRPVDFLTQSFSRTGGIYRSIRGHNPNGKMLQNNVDLINYDFNKSLLDRKLFYNKSYGFKGILFNIMYNVLSSRKFGFIDINHHPQAHLKSSMEYFWSNHYPIMKRTSSNKFRSKDDITEYVCRYYSLATGNFYPKKFHDSLSKSIKQVSDMDFLRNLDKELRFLCVCDDVEFSEQEFDLIKSKLSEFLDTLLPNKSSFEK
ncbi:stealth conserved region 3 domain-containing protein [Vibrio owensii]